MRLIELFNKRVIKIGLLLLLLFQFYNIPYHLLGVDSGAILPTARDVVKFNKIPYTELFTIYTPLAYYFYGVLYYFFDVPPMHVIIIYNWVFLIAAALLLRNAISKKYSDSIALIFLLISSPLAFDVKIETIAMPFLVFLSLKTVELFLANDFYIMLRKMVVIGLFISILFLFKQYYLLLIPEIFLVLLLNTSFTSFSLKNKFAIILGFTTAFIFFTFIFFLIIFHFDFSNFNLNDFLIQLEGKNYNGCSPFSHINSIGEVISAYLRYMVLLLPIALTLMILLLYSKGARNFIIFTIIVLIPLILFLFNIQPHSMFIIEPFILILFLGIFNNKIYDLYFTLNKLRANLLLTIVWVTLIFFISRNQVYADILNLNYNKRTEAYKRFLNESLEIQNIVGDQKSVYLGHGINQLLGYYLNFSSIDEKRIGYIHLTPNCTDALFKSGNKGLILIKENNLYKIFSVCP